MVFHSKAASVRKRFNYQDNPWDNSSIGSTISSDFDIFRTKNDPKKAFSDIHQEWHVVPSGGAKAREEFSNQHPYPCRYDEYDIYLTQDKKDDKILPEQSYETKHKSDGTNTDNEYTLQKEGDISSNKSSDKNITKQNAKDKMKYCLVGEEIMSSDSQYHQSLTKSNNKNNNNYQKESDADNNDGDGSQTNNSSKGEEKNKETNANQEVNNNDETGMKGSDNGDIGEGTKTNKNTDGNDNTNGKDKWRQKRQRKWKKKNNNKGSGT
jgi:hypothetical protein